MTERQPQDALARAQAIDPALSFIVQAPAGSGKTELLTDRILALLSIVAKPEEIVAITFTRKAAAEMHARVLSKLSLARAKTPAKSSHEARSLELAKAALARSDELGWHLLDHPARLSIRTIDAFCSGLVRSMPWLTSMGGMPKIVDDPKASYLAAAREVFAMADSDPSVRLLLQHMDLDINAACEAIANMLGQRDQWMPLLSDGANRQLLESKFGEAVSEELEAIAALMPASYAEQLAPLVSKAVNILAAEEKYIQTYEKVQCLADWQGAPFGTDLDSLPKWKALELFLFKREPKPILRTTVDVRLGFLSKSDHRQRFIDWLGLHNQGATPGWAKALKTVEHMIDAQFTPEQWHVLQAQMHCLLLAAAQLKLQFSLTGEVDFIEMAQRADQALGRADDPTDLLLKLDAGIKHLLIDEFQDTSQSQISLLAKITSGWQQGDGRTLFLVGDPMQSIYRFRKAEVGLFLGVRDRGLNGLKPIALQLTDNFRSQAGIVDWVNDTFKKVFPSQDDAPAGAIAYAASKPFNPEGRIPAVRQHIVLSDDLEAPAPTLLQLVRDALRSAPDSDHPVAILVRARSNLRGATELLTKEGIPYRAIELVALNKRAYVVDLVQIVRALNHVGDRAAWLAVLRSPYCGLKLESLHQLFAQNQHQTVLETLERFLEVNAEAKCQAEQLLEPEEYARLRLVAEVLIKAVRQESFEVLARRVQRVWQALDGPQLATQRSDLSDAESVFRLIETLAPYGGLDLDVFEARLTKLYASPQTEIKQHPGQESAKGIVEVMTMHKSKGLQFDTVILYGLHELPMADKTPLVRIEQVGGRVLFGPAKSTSQQEQDPFSKFLGQREKRRANYEVDRLLYVAATRARESLHLVARIGLNKEKTAVAEPAPTSLLARLWPYLDPVELTNTDLTGQDQSTTVPYFVGPALQRRKFVASPVIQTNKEPQAFAYNQPYVWEDRRGDERQIGTLVHEWLAHIGQSGLDNWTPEKISRYLPIIEKQLSYAGVPALRTSAGAQEVVESLVAMLTHEKGRWLLAHTKGKREWALLDSTGKISVIDLALDQGDHWFVVDYKTGRPVGTETPDDFGQRMLSRYEPQLIRYQQQLQALDGRPARAALYFPRDDLWVEMGLPC